MTSLQLLLSDESAGLGNKGDVDSKWLQRARCNPLVKYAKRPLSQYTLSS